MSSTLMSTYDEDDEEEIVHEEHYRMPSIQVKILRISELAMDFDLHDQGEVDRMDVDRIVWCR